MRGSMTNQNDWWRSVGYGQLLAEGIIRTFIRNIANPPIARALERAFEATHRGKNRTVRIRLVLGIDVVEPPGNVVEQIHQMAEEFFLPRPVWPGGGDE